MEKRFVFLLVNLFLFVGMAFAQTKISGTVVSQEDGEAIIGASVIVEGTKTGVATDIDGRFSIDVPAGKKLVVSYIGMQSKVVTPKPGMKIALVVDDKTLQEVVVTGMVVFVVLLLSLVAQSLFGLLTVLLWRILPMLMQVSCLLVMPRH